LESTLLGPITKFVTRFPVSARRTGKRIILAFIGLLFALYFSSSARISDLQQVQLSGTLHMLTVAGPTTYYEDGRGKNGLEYLLAKAFAGSLGVELVVQSKPNLNALLLSVGGPEGNFAAANITVSENRSKLLQFTTPYMQVTQHLIYRRGSARPRSLGDIDGDLVVLKSSSHSEQLKYWTEKYPQLKWREDSSSEMSEMLRMIHDREIDYTVVDSLAYLVSRHIYPQVRRAIDISDPQPVAWAFPRHGDGTLLAAANRFLSDYSASGELAALKNDLLEQADNFSVAGSQRFGQLVNSRLPNYEPLFRVAAEQFGFEWHLLAAVAYQESHWNPRARSPTGVRGLMMLTLNTAREMKIKNRLDPQQSLTGGAAYLSKLRARLPDRIGEPDRTLLALAAYNIGFGHLEDARILTQRNGQDPDQWEHVRQHLPKLSNKQYYQSLKYGYARGNEPVIYVANIRYYRRYLELHELSQQQPELQNVEELQPNSEWEDSAPSSL
jgi:membrane-bound lytic murein transglycosylase F